VGSRYAAVTGVQTCALPILRSASVSWRPVSTSGGPGASGDGVITTLYPAGGVDPRDPGSVPARWSGGACDERSAGSVADRGSRRDRKSTRLNSSHGSISYAV